MRQIDILQAIKYESMLSVNNERSFCDAIEKLWFDAGLDYKREVKLASGPVKNTKYIEKSLIWFRGDYYSQIIADFLIDDIAIEVKFRNDRLWPKNCAGQMAQYLQVPGISQVLLLICEKISDKNLISIYEISCSDGKKLYFSLLSNFEIKSCESSIGLQLNLDKELTLSKFRDSRLGALIDYTKVKAARDLEKMNEGYRKAGYL